MGGAALTASRNRKAAPTITLTQAATGGCEGSDPTSGSQDERGAHERTKVAPFSSEASQAAPPSTDSRRTSLGEEQQDEDGEPGGLPVPMGPTFSGNSLNPKSLIWGRVASDDSTNQVGSAPSNTETSDPSSPSRCSSRHASRHSSLASTGSARSASAAQLRSARRKLSEARSPSEYRKIERLMLQELSEDLN